MNRIFRTLWSHTLQAWVVTSEVTKSCGKSGSEQATTVRSVPRGNTDTKLSKHLSLRPLVMALAAASQFAVPLHAANLAMPSGAILDINNGSASNSASNVANQFQTYTVNYTATASGNNYFLFAFRQDPSYWTFGNLGLYAPSNSTNLFTNPLFTQGGAVGSSGLQAPTSWGVVYQTGSPPRAAGTWHAPGSSGASTTNVNQAGIAGSWYDGAVGSFDGIYQGVELVAGITYSLSFTASTTGLANTAGSGNGGIELGVFAGQCITLTGAAANCTPNNSDFTSLATPSVASSAGGPTTTTINSTTSTDTLGSNLGKFDGGRLRASQDSSLSQNFSTTSNGGVIDQAGHRTTLSGTIVNDIQGTPGPLTIANSGVGGRVILTGANTYTGRTTIDSGATLGISGGGSIASSSGIQNNGLLDISDANGNVAIQNIGGTGNVALGAHNLVIALGDNRSITGTVSGTGGIAVNGGIQVLGGTNTYAGGTRVSNATVQISNDQNLGDASGSLALNNGTLHVTSNATMARNTVVTNTGAFITDSGTTTTSTGTVSGTGALVKNGAGMLELKGTASHTGGTTVNGGALVLGGVNTYTGGNTVNGGTLQVSSDANLGDVSNAIALNGGILRTTGDVTTARNITVSSVGVLSTDGGTTTTSTGSVSGSGALVKNGSGSLAMGGTLSHAGGTTVNNGVLTLSGNNGYTGGNTVNGGTLQVSSDANLGDISNAIALNGGILHTTGDITTARNITVSSVGVLSTDSGTTTTSTGSLSGSGALVKVGAGTLMLSGSNSYSGGTVVGGGVLQISKSSALGTGTVLLQGGSLKTTTDVNIGQQVIASKDATFEVGNRSTAILSTGITGTSGNGCFVKAGAGKLNLMGSSNLASGTCVQEGILSANGTLNSTFIEVDTAGVLRGTGFVSGPVAVQGTLAAGNSPGTLTVQGSVAMQATGTLQVDIDGEGIANGAGNYSRILVVGAGNTFTANGTLAPTLRGITGNASNTYTPVIGTSYRVVDAEGGVIGRFSTLAQPSAGLDASTRFIAFYGTNNGKSIDLRVIPTSYTSYLSGMGTRNDLAAATALDRTIALTDAASASDKQNALLYAVSDATSSRISALVKELSGEVHAAVAASARIAGLGMHRDVIDHLGAYTDNVDSAHRLWVNVANDGNRSAADQQGSSFSNKSKRGTVGIDLYKENGTVFGVAGTNHETTISTQNGSGAIRGTSGMVYAQQKLGQLVLNGVAAYGDTTWTTFRTDPLLGTSLSSRNSGKDAMGSLTLSLPIHMASGNRIEPYTSVIRQKVERDGSSEQGASPAALALTDFSRQGTRIVGGISVSSKVIDPLMTSFTWHANAALGVDNGGLLNPAVRNALAGQSFDTAAPGVGRSFVQLNSIGTARLSNSTYLYGSLSGEKGRHRSGYGLTAGVRVAF